MPARTTSNSRPTHASVITVTLAFVASVSRYGSAHAAERPDAALAREAEPKLILQIALAQNPDLHEERARVSAARARTQQVARLPEPNLTYQQWGVPLRRPLSLDKADTLMLGLSQSFPAAGTRGAQERMAGQDEQVAAATDESRRLDLRAQVQHAFADYYRANRQIRLHREHVELTAQLVGLARGSYRSGQRGQQDVLKLSLELSRLHSDLAHLEQEERSARALLNALMNRSVDAPLGPPAELVPATNVPLPDAEQAIATRRSEVAAARATLQRSEAAIDLARREANWPTFMVGVDYWYMPLMDDPHAYGAMVSMSLPWLNPGRRDAIRAAEYTAAADRHALASVRNTIRYQVRDAAAKYEAARSTFSIIDTDLLPQAKRNFEASQAGYSTGQADAIALVDALRSYLEVRLDRVRALVHLETTATDLERAVASKEMTR